MNLTKLFYDRKKTLDIMFFHRSELFFSIDLANFAICNLISKVIS